MIDQSLTFDGVYEIAPHPMYSVGYAGYYVSIPMIEFNNLDSESNANGSQGISLFSASYTVFTVSLIAHAAQFAFLVLVEDPRKATIPETSVWSNILTFGIFRYPKNLQSSSPTTQVGAPKTIAYHRRWFYFQHDRTFTPAVVFI